ncbi:hypothetical protein FHX15_000834 [Rhizobium sp. BK650]|nr:hypothetical protein [Rhizobium sp. BK650]
MRIYLFFIACQVSLLMWGSAYYSARGIYQTLDASRSSDTSVVSREVAGKPH